MTIFFPDVSHYNNVTIVPGTVAVLAKATHGTSFVESSYSKFKTQCAVVGAHFVAYHWLNHGNVQAQAAYCFKTVGKTPLMLDCEDQPGNTGYAGPLTAADITGFVQAYRQLGGVVHLAYIPHWYWQDHMGSPSLTPLTNLGVGLVSSSYTKYSDTGPGWNAYGGATPVQWQYTDALSYGGGQADFNAFRGTIEQYIALTTGGMDVTAFDDWNPNFKDGVQRSPSTCLKELWEMLAHGKWMDGVNDAPMHAVYTNVQQIPQIVTAVVGLTTAVSALPKSTTAVLTPDQISELKADVTATISAAVQAGLLTRDDVVAACETALGQTKLTVSPS